MTTAARILDPFAQEAVKGLGRPGVRIKAIIPYSRRSSEITTTHERVNEGNACFLGQKTV